MNHTVPMNELETCGYVEKLEVSSGVSCLSVKHYE